MDAGDLALLDVIICEGGITAAARKLGQPKTTLSRRLQMLEKSIGAQLFDRKGRQLRLTRIGEAFAAPARDVRAAVAAAEALVEANATDDQGALRIAAPMLFGRRVLVPFLAQFMAARPRATASLTFDQTPLDPLRQDLDLAFSVHRPEAPYLIVQKLVEFDIGIYGVPELARNIRAPEDLANVPAIHTASAGHGPKGWTLTQGATVHRVDAPARATVNDPEAAATFILQGLGIGGLPAFVAEDYVRAGDLVSVLPGMTVGRVAIHGASPPLRNQIPIVRTFLADLRAELRTWA